MSSTNKQHLLNGAFSLALQVAALTTNREWTYPADAPAVGQSLRIAGGSTSTNIIWEYFTPTEGETPTSQNQNTVYAAPDGATGLPTFRLLVPADIPNLSAAKITSGTFDIARLPVGTGANTVAAGNDSRFHGQNTDFGTDKNTFQINTGAGGARVGSPDGTTIELRNGQNTDYANLIVKKITASEVDYNQVNNVAYGDNILRLNNEYTGSTPTENAGLEINRGTLTAASLLWDEGTDEWEANDIPIARIQRFTFTSANVVDGKVTITHTLGKQHNICALYNNTGDKISPPTRAVNTTTLEFDLTNITVTGTWTAVLEG